MRFRPALLTALLLCACAPAAAPAAAPPPEEQEVEVVRETETTVVEVQVGMEGSAASFVPAVPAGGSDAEAECEFHPLGSVIPDESLLLLSYRAGGADSRVVSLAFGPTGTLRRYNDLRGNLRHGEAGPATRIVIDFEQGTAVAMNQRPGHPDQAVFGTPAEFLSAPAMGDPERMIELVTRRCAPVAAPA